MSVSLSITLYIYGHVNFFLYMLLLQGLLLDVLDRC